jgi:hypothetical protein
MRQLFPSPVEPVDPADVYGAPPDALARAARVAGAGLLDELCLSLSPAWSAATPSASWTASRSPARWPCACARSASRTGSCSCATARGRVARLPAWTH